MLVIYYIGNGISLILICISLITRDVVYRVQAYWPLLKCPSYPFLIIILLLKHPERSNSGVNCGSQFEGATYHGRKARWWGACGKMWLWQVECEANCSHPSRSRSRGRRRLTPTWLPPFLSPCMALLTSFLSSDDLLRKCLWREVQSCASVMLTVFANPWG